MNRRHVIAITLLIVFNASIPAILLVFNATWARLIAVLALEVLFGVWLLTVRLPAQETPSATKTVWFVLAHCLWLGCSLMEFTLPTLLLYLAVVESERQKRQWNLRQQMLLGIAPWLVLWGGSSLPGAQNEMFFNIAATIVYASLMIFWLGARRRQWPEVSWMIVMLVSILLFLVVSGGWIGVALLATIIIAPCSAILRLT
ncbi:MAG TPA: hypothetical protein PKW95_05330 [bacterium]|nr:hypothetical protein [bacterium]